MSASAPSYAVSDASFAQYLLDDISRNTELLLQSGWLSGAQAETIQAQLAAAGDRAASATSTAAKTGPPPSYAAAAPMPTVKPRQGSGTALVSQQQAAPNGAKPTNVAPRPNSVMQPVQVIVVPTHDLPAQQAGDLALVKGERIVVLDSWSDPSWWTGQSPSGLIGIFPVTYVKVVQGTPGVPPPQPPQQQPTVIVQQQPPTTVVVQQQQQPTQQQPSAGGQFGRNMGNIVASSAAFGYCAFFVGLHVIKIRSF